MWEGVRGEDFQGDIAIDSITIKRQKCGIYSAKGNNINAVDSITMSEGKYATTGISWVFISFNEMLMASQFQINFQNMHITIKRSKMWISTGIQ